jgi:hypothetical protein
MGLRPNLEIQREVRTTILGVQAEIKKPEQQKNNWAQNKVWPKSFQQKFFLPLKSSTRDKVHILISKPHKFCVLKLWYYSLHLMRK